MACAKLVVYVSADDLSGRRVCDSEVIEMVLDRISAHTGVCGVPVMMVESIGGQMPDYVIDIEFVRQSEHDQPEIDLVLDQLASAIENLFPQTTAYLEFRSMQLSITSKIGAYRQVVVNA